MPTTQIVQAADRLPKIGGILTATSIIPLLGATIPHPAQWAFWVTGISLVTLGGMLAVAPIFQPMTWLHPDEAVNDEYARIDAELDAEELDAQSIQRAIDRSLTAVHTELAKDN